MHVIYTLELAYLSHVIFHIIQQLVLRLLYIKLSCQNIVYGLDGPGIESLGPTQPLHRVPGLSQR
jgi:hypothetical protein